MHWVRKPRLYSAVATVAVEMVFSLLRVSSLNLVMALLVRFADSVDRGFIDRRAEAVFEEIEISALVGLPYIAREHPAIAALVAGFGLLLFAPALRQLLLRNVEIAVTRLPIHRD